MPEIIKLQSNMSIQDNGEVVETREKRKRNRRRSQSRNYLPASVQRRNLGNPIVRVSTFNSRTFGSPFNSSGVVAIGNNGRLVLTDTLRDPDGRTLFSVPEFSVYVGQVTNSNEWPDGAFFDDSSAVQEEVNYDIISNISFQSSSNNVIVHYLTIVNRTGESVDIGIKSGFRYVVNANRDPNVTGGGN